MAKGHWQNKANNIPPEKLLSKTYLMSIWNKRNSLCCCCCKIPCKNVLLSELLLGESILSRASAAICRPCLVCCSHASTAKKEKLTQLNMQLSYPSCFIVSCGYWERQENKENKSSIQKQPLLQKIRDKTTVKKTHSKKVIVIWGNSSLTISLCGEGDVMFPFKTLKTKVPFNVKYCWKMSWKYLEWNLCLLLITKYR